MEYVDAAIAPLIGRISDQTIQRLRSALALLFGMEALVVLKDVTGATVEEAIEMILWAGTTLIRSVEDT